MSQQPAAPQSIALAPLISDDEWRPKAKDRQINIADRKHWIWKRQLGGKNGAALYEFRRACGEKVECIVKFPQKRSEVVQEALAGEITDWLLTEFMHGKRHHFACASLIRDEKSGFGVIQAKSNIEELTRSIGSQGHDGDRSVLKEVISGRMFYAKINRLGREGLAEILMHALLLGDYSVHSGNIGYLLNPDGVATSAMLRIDLGAAFRNFFSDKNSHILEPEEQQGLLAGLTKDYIYNYLHLPGLRVEIAECARKLRASLGADRDKIVAKVKELIDEIPTDLLNDSVRKKLTKELGYNCDLLWREPLNELAHRDFAGKFADILLNRLNQICELDVTLKWQADKCNTYLQQAGLTGFAQEELLRCPTLLALFSITTPGKEPPPLSFERYSMIRALWSFKNRALKSVINPAMDEFYDIALAALVKSPKEPIRETIQKLASQLLEKTVADKPSFFSQEVSEQVDQLMAYLDWQMGKAKDGVFPDAQILDAKEKEIVEIMLQIEHQMGPSWQGDGKSFLWIPAQRITRELCETVRKLLQHHHIDVTFYQCGDGLYFSGKALSPNIIKYLATPPIPTLAKLPGSADDVKAGARAESKVEVGGAGAATAVPPYAAAAAAALPPPAALVATVAQHSGSPLVGGGAEQVQGPGLGAFEVMPIKPRLFRPS